jgi:hypothetical protein
MKKIILLIIVNLILILIQVAFVPTLFTTVGSPNFILALGFTFLIIDKLEMGLQSVLIGGIMLDSMLYNHIGISSIILTIGILISFIVRKYFFKGLLTHAVFIIISSVIYSQLLIYKSFTFNLTMISNAIITTLISLIGVFIAGQLKSQTKY